MNRQKVHLSTDVKTATKVGNRHKGKTVILEIDSKKAHEDGIKFYIGNEDVWLADEIPAQYITKRDKNDLLNLDSGTNSINRSNGES